jgi:hypothetical protein
VAGEEEEVGEGDKAEVVGAGFKDGEHAVGERKTARGAVGYAQRTKEGACHDAAVGDNEYIAAGMEGGELAEGGGNALPEVVVGFDAGHAGPVGEVGGMRQAGGGAGGADLVGEGAFQGTEVALPEGRGGLDGEVEVVGEDIGGLGGAGKIGGEAGGKFVLGGREDLGEGLGLSAAFGIQMGGGLALDAAGAVPVSLAVADEPEMGEGGHGTPTSACEFRGPNRLTDRMIV